MFGVAQRSATISVGSALHKLKLSSVTALNAWGAMLLARGRHILVNVSSRSLGGRARKPDWSNSLLCSHRPLMVNFLRRFIVGDASEVSVRSEGWNPGCRCKSTRLPNFDRRRRMEATMNLWGWYTVLSRLGAICKVALADLSSCNCARKQATISCFSPIVWTRSSPCLY